MDDLKKTKSFWERPEGTTGMLTIGAGLLGLWFTKDAIISLLGSIITILGQGITIAVLGSVLFAILMIVTNKKFQTLVSYMFKSVMRKITGLFVEIDPIGIMRSYISDLKNKRESMSDARSKLKGQVDICKRQIEKNSDDYTASMRTAEEAKKRGMQSAVTVNGRQAMRLEALNKEKLQPMLDQMVLHLRALDKYYEVTGTFIEDLENEVKTREMERNMILASYSAMSAAKKILQGGTDQRELFDQAMEFVVNDFSMKMGEIDNFIETSRSFVDGLDLQNGVMDAEAMKRLQDWESSGDSLLLGNTKQQLIDNTSLQVGVPAAAQSVDYIELLSKK